MPAAYTNGPVRDLPGVVAVNSPYLHIEGSSGVAVAFHGPGATQTVNVQQKVEQAQALAEAIEWALPAVTDNQVRAEAEHLALEIRSESSSEAPKPGRLKALATTAMTFDRHSGRHGLRQGDRRDGASTAVVKESVAT